MLTSANIIGIGVVVGKALVVTPGAQGIHVQRAGVAGFAFLVRRPGAGETV